MNMEYLRDLERRYVWAPDVLRAPVWRRVALSTVRTLILIVRDLAAGDLSMRAMSLVYTTLLSMVPLLALSFSILKGFGVQNRLDDTLRAMFEPLGDEKAAQLTESTIEFVNNMNVGVLGAVGLIMLLYTVVSLMQKIEGAFNSVWRISAARSFGERFATFISAITVGPVLIFSAIALTGSVMNTAAMAYIQSMAVIGSTIELLVRLMPYALVITAFSFLYAFIPNTRVRIVAALTGGVVAGVLWELLGFAFATFAAGATSYQAIYATFATAILFLIWLHLNWLILLVGASISFYRQHPEVVATGLQRVHFSPALRDRYALSLLARIGQRLYGAQEPYTAIELAQEYGVPGHALMDVLLLLVDIDVLAETDDAEPAFIAKVPFDSTDVATVLEAIGRFQPPGTYAPRDVPEPRIAALDSALIGARARALSGLTLKQLALGDGPFGESDVAPVPDDAPAAVDDGGFEEQGKQDVAGRPRDSVE